LTALGINAFFSFFHNDKKLCIAISGLDIDFKKKGRTQCPTFSIC